MFLNKIIVIAFITSILIIISSSQISFAKENEKVEEDDGKDLKKDIAVS